MRVNFELSHLQDPRRPARAIHGWVCALGILLVSVGGLVFPRVCLAKDATPGSKAAAAEALFSAARSDLAAGQLDAACEKFQDSLKLERATGTLLNLAACESKRGRLASAWSLWREALEILPPGDSRISFATRELNLLLPRLPYLTLRLERGVPKGVKVSRNGMELGHAGMNLPIPVDPGPHTIRVQAPGYDTREYSITAKEGSSETLSLNVGVRQKVSQKHPGLTKEDTRAPRASTLWPWVTVGVGGAGLGAAVATTFLLERDRSTVERECDSVSKLCSSKGFDAVKRTRTLLPVNTVSFGVAALGLTGGIYWLTSVASDEPEERVPALAITLTKETLGVDYETQF